MSCPDITAPIWTQPLGKRGCYAGRQHGLSMIELLIALLIGLFLLGGMSILVQNNRRTTAAQTQLSKLQDMERVAMGLVTDMIQQAGYFPDPTSNTSATWAAISGKFSLGAAVFAQPNQLSAPYVGDWLFLRYATANNDGILNCDGSTNTSGALSINVAFYFAYNGQLNCRQSANTQSANSFGSFGPYVPLIGDALGTLNGINLTNFTVLYGVNSAGTSQNVDTYKNAAQLASSDWLNIIAMQITFTFTNPLYVAANPAGQPQYVSVTRVVSVMHQTGI